MLGLKLSQKDHEEKLVQEKDNDRRRVVGTSSQGFDDATAMAIKNAVSAFPKLDGAQVKHMTVAVRDGKVSEYRVELKVKVGKDGDD